METSVSKIFVSMETAVKVFTAENCRLISIIQHKKPASVRELCQLSGRAQPNVSRALAILEKAGIVKLAGVRTKRPELTSSSITVNVEHQEVEPQEVVKALLKKFAQKYIWWKTAEEAMVLPQYIAAQVMNIGEYQDVQSLVNVVGDDYLRQVVTQSEIGQFDKRSWCYWHYRLGLARLEEVPPMPERKLG